MESEKIHNCSFCENPNILKKCGKSHTRCKQIRFCNKNCETAAHSKERKSKVTANENPGDESLKNAIESEIKRDRKTHQNFMYAMNNPDNVIMTPDKFKALQGMTSSVNFPGARNGQRRGIRVPQSPEDGTQDQS
jgi:hypothetical protein